MKEFIRSVMRIVARGLNAMSGGLITPNMITITSLLAHIPIAYLIATSHNYWAAGLLVVFGLFDALDGELARLQKRASAAGMLLDSVTDRMKEIMIYTAVGYAIIATTGRPFLAVWAISACGASVLVSYINAWGEAVMSRHAGKQASINKAFRGGLLAFEIRMALVIIGLLTNHLALLVIVITIGASYTALTRLVRVLGALNRVQD